MKFVLDVNFSLALTVNFIQVRFPHTRRGFSVQKDGRDVDFCCYFLLSRQLRPVPGVSKCSKRASPRLGCPRWNVIKAETVARKDSDGLRNQRGRHLNPQDLWVIELCNGINEISSQYQQQLIAVSDSERFNAGQRKTEMS